MRLEKIKLCGFKSFVDPTSIPVPGNLVGVVGPNGCGKSNIIDAVRWVMGESSAKHLRGDLMADVIFNGSNSRKPVGMASVELLFDNSDGRAGGEYAKYSSVSIKRQVRRDGQSIYLLNGGRCRRKDITDIFLGTGLGPRSYAIIEQGTISRLIEAKPEEIRVYVEEAAGISKYKERRHDTEIRMRHTRENLARLDDLREEVGKQLKHLQSQARKAEKFVAFRKQKRSYEQELLAMRWQAQKTTDRELGDDIGRIEQQLKTFAEDEQTVDQALEAANRAHKKMQQALNDVQADYYSRSSDISRIEQAISHAQAGREDLAHELDRLQQEQQQCQVELEQDTQNLASINEELNGMEQCLSDAETNYAKCLDRHNEAIAGQEDWQQQWNAVAADAAELKQETQVQKARIEHQQQSERMLEERLRRLRDELGAAHDSGLGQQISGLDADVSLLHKQQQAIALKAEQSAQSANEQRQRVKQCQVDLHTAQASLQTIDARMASLEVLQQHAMGTDNAALSEWLEDANLSGEPRLAQHLKVEAGWETAVEAILDHFLEAICVDDLETVFSKLEKKPEQHGLAIFETGLSSDEGPTNKPDALLSKVESPWSLKALLDGFFCAEDLHEARHFSASLQPHEWIVTPDGSLLGPGRLLIRRDKDAQDGLLNREAELRKLKQQHRQLQDECGRLEQKLEVVEEDLREAEDSSEEAQQHYREASAEMSDKSAELSAIRASHQHAEDRCRQIQEEIIEVEEIQRNNTVEADQAARQKEEAETKLAAVEDRKQILTEEQKQIRVRIEESETLLQAAREQVHRHQSRAESLKSSALLTESHLQRSTGQHQQLLQRIQDIQAKLGNSDSPIEQQKEQLDELMADRAELEQALAKARRDVEESEAEMVRLSEKRTKIERAIESERGQLDQLRMDKQTAHVRCQTITEQLQEFNVLIDDVLANLADDADEQNWQDAVAELDTKIQRLGSVNLTAIEEHEQQSERMEYLNEQCDDLNESLATLEKAMRKIDHECRERFKSTFDRINSHMQKNFPKLFGGGHAQLEIDDQNLLESGINIVARPPGKRNTSIHLLSGGEKALTAVALIFSIFELNPAPFCLLDEVDAPLDDANTVRFSQLVEAMSETVQFLFITHNKATMEIARHLTGVTMREPGVSHMVAVDLEEAVELAAV